MKVFAVLVSSLLLSAPVLALAPPPAGTASPPQKLDTRLPPSDVGAPADMNGKGNAASPRDERGETPPDVTVKRQGDNVIATYSRNGKVYMVTVVPKHGVPYSYSVTNGNLQPQAGAPPVTPAMYKVLEWGKPPAPASSSGD